jgi:FkbM family methyltransferase
MDGIIYSNTKFFEDKLKFKGILIEPTIQYNNLINNRPNCDCYNVAINYITGKVKFLGESATAGMVDTMNETFKKGWHSNNTNEYYVNSEPISNIFKKSNISYIDLITIDVEGGEQVVLETIDFNIPIYLICIELDGHNINKDDNCRKILKKNGFVFKKRLCINEFWINENYYRKSLLYDSSISFKYNHSSIRELGHFPFLENHLITEVENSLKN